MSKRQALWKQIAALLRSERQPMTIAEVSEMVEAKQDGVSKTFDRLDMFTRVPSADGIHRYARRVKDDAA